MNELITTPSFDEGVLSWLKDIKVPKDYLLSYDQYIVDEKWRHKFNKITNPIKKTQELCQILYRLRLYSQWKSNRNLGTLNFLNQYAYGIKPTSLIKIMEAYPALNYSRFMKEEEIEYIIKHTRKNYSKNYETFETCKNRPSNSTIKNCKRSCRKCWTLTVTRWETPTGLKVVVKQVRESIISYLTNLSELGRIKEMEDLIEELQRDFNNVKIVGGETDYKIYIKKKIKQLWETSGDDYIAYLNKQTEEKIKNCKWC
jgi:hypothetical protein